jgi:hypothetical protein
MFLHLGNLDIKLKEGMEVRNEKKRENINNVQTPKLTNQNKVLCHFHEGYAPHSSLEQILEASVNIVLIIVSRNSSCVFLALVWYRKVGVTVWDLLKKFNPKY